MALTEFNRSFFDSDQRISYIGNGELGGKAGSLKLFNDILEDSDFSEFKRIEINIPTFTVLRTDVFDQFMSENNLYEIAYSDMDDNKIGIAFQKASLPFSIKAMRSSFENFLKNMIMATPDKMAMIGIKTSGPFIILNICFP